MPCPFQKKNCCIFISHTHLFFAACSFFSSAFTFSSLSFASALSPTTLEVGSQGWIHEFNYRTFQYRDCQRHLGGVQSLISRTGVVGGAFYLCAVWRPKSIFKTGCGRMGRTLLSGMGAPPRGEGVPRPAPPTKMIRAAGKWRGKKKVIFSNLCKEETNDGTIMQL